MYLLKVSIQVVVNENKIYINVLRIPFHTIKEAYDFGKMIANSNTIEDAFIYVCKKGDEDYDIMIHSVERDWYLDYE